MGIDINASCLDPKCHGILFFFIRVPFLVYGALEFGIGVIELKDKLWEWT